MQSTQSQAVSKRTIAYVYDKDGVHGEVAAASGNDVHSFDPSHELDMDVTFYPGGGSLVRAGPDLDVFLATLELLPQGVDSMTIFGKPRPEIAQVQDWIKTKDVVRAAYRAA